MLEKQARMKQAGAALRQAVQDVTSENAYNLKAAQHNMRVQLTGVGEAKPYRNNAVLRMIKQASNLVDEAVAG